MALRVSACLFKIGHVGPQGIQWRKEMGHALIRRGVDETTTLSVVSSFLHNVVTVHGWSLQNLHLPGRAVGLFPSVGLLDPVFLFLCYQEVIEAEAPAVILCCCCGVYLLSPVPSAPQSGAAAEEIGNQMSDIPSASLCSDLSRPAVSKLHFV